MIWIEAWVVLGLFTSSLAGAAWGVRGAISSFAIGAASGVLLAVGMQLLPLSHPHSFFVSPLRTGATLAIIWWIVAFPGIGIGLAIRAMRNRQISN